MFPGDMAGRQVINVPSPESIEQTDCEMREDQKLSLISPFRCLCHLCDRKQGQIVDSAMK